jgi:hypothetical protein
MRLLHVAAPLREAEESASQGQKCFMDVGSFLVTDERGRRDSDMVTESERKMLVIVSDP